MIVFVLTSPRRCPYLKTGAVIVAFWLMMPGPASYAQGWEVDWGAVSEAGAAIASRIQQFSFTEHLQALTEAVEVDWRAVERLVDRVLQEHSWENAAALRPLAEQTVAHLDQLEGGEDAAAWLRRRLDYLRIAEQYVEPHRSPPPVTLPAHGAAIAHPAPAPKTKPPVSRHVDVDQDMQLWLKHLPVQRSSYAAQTVPGLKRIFESEGIPPALVWLAEVESSFNPNARSPAGATGLFQFMPATAGRFGLALTPLDQRLDPSLSATAAARYLRLLHRQFSDWPLALAAYNAGEGRVGRTLQRHNAQRFEAIADHLPLETQMYVPRIAAVIWQREGLDLHRLPHPR